MGNGSREPEPEQAEYALRSAYYADDPCVIEAESKPWEILVSPINPGPFQHWKQYLITPSLIVYREAYESAVRMHGLAPAGMFSITLPLNLGSRSSYWNAPPESNGFHASISGSVDAVFDSGQSHLMVLIDLKLLRKTLPPEVILRLENAAQTRFINADPRSVEVLTYWLCRVLLETENHQNAALNRLAICAFEDELLDRLARTVQLDMPPRRRPLVSLRQRGLKLALRFLSESNDPGLTIPELCKAANVSQRTLEYAFREQFNLTPLGFLKLRRIHRARYELMTSSHAQATVTQIAHHNGFLEAGRFATEYRILFGELPSQTLKCAHPKRQEKNRSPLLWKVA